jgi:hypothetical protein
MKRSSRAITVSCFRRSGDPAHCNSPGAHAGAAEAGAEGAFRLLARKATGVLGTVAMDADRYSARDLRRFLLTFAATIFAVLAVRYALIFIVDPRARFNFDMNNVTVYREREGKPWLIGNYPHNAILIGTSTLARVNPVDVDTPELKFFNASFSGALPEEIYRFLKAFVPSAKLVVLSFDVIVMNEGTWPLREYAEWVEPSLKDVLISHFQYLNENEALMMAIDQVVHGIPQQPGTLFRNGARNAPLDIARSNAMAAPDFVGPLATMRSAAFTAFKYSEARVGYLQRIKALLDERQIPHVVLISPENRQMLDMIRDSGSQWALDKFRADVRRIFPDAIDYSNSWVSADENFFKFDPLHYFPGVGARMVKEAVAQAQPR